MDNADALLVSCPDIQYSEELTADDPLYMEIWELYSDALDLLDAWPSESSHIGGWPVWVQGEDTPSNMKLLLQLNDFDNAPFMWGDAGSLYLFYSDSGEFEIVVQGC